MENTQHKPRTTPKDFFLHLGVMVALYAAVISFITLLYGIINHYFPDVALIGEYYYGGSAYQINGAAAAFIVTFPLFLILARIAERDVTKHPEKRELWIRKWLIFFTLFVAGVTMAVDLIVLVKYFFDGELTMRFFMKVIVIFLISIAIFSYFMYELRNGTKKRSVGLFALATLSSIIALAVLCLSFTVIGSPFEQRNYKLDETRVQHLTEIAYNIISYRTNYGDVPETLAILLRNGFPVQRDPRTGADYEFRRISTMEFEICATFERATRPINAHPSVPKSMPAAIRGGDMYEWDHGVGRTCFEREIFADQVRTNMPFEKPIPISHP